MAMSDHEVWITAGELFAEFERDSSGNVVDRLMNLADGLHSVDDWRRVAAAVAVMEAAREQ